MRITALETRKGFTLVEIMIVLAIIGLLMAIAIPNFVRHREGATRNICIENLHKIEAAKQTWGLEAGKNTGDLPQPSDIFGPTAYIRSTPTCPSTGQDYTLNPLGIDVQCQVPTHTF